LFDQTSKIAACKKSAHKVSQLVVITIEYHRSIQEGCDHTMESSTSQTERPQKLQNPFIVGMFIEINRAGNHWYTGEDLD
jgi:hypothetical protein